MLEVPTDEARPVLSLDMTRMNRLLSLDDTNGIAVIESGATGRALEVALNEKGYTMGHEPDVRKAVCRDSRCMPIGETSGSLLLTSCSVPHDLCYTIAEL